MEKIEQFSKHIAVVKISEPKVHPSCADVVVRADFPADGCSVDICARVPMKHPDAGADVQMLNVDVDKEEIIAEALNLLLRTLREVERVEGDH